MNNKILVTVFVPFLNDSFDVFIPINKKVGTIKSILISTINEMSNNSISSKNLKLYEKGKSNLLDNNIYVNACGLRNGSELILL